MGKQESKELQILKQKLILELEKRVKDKILENENKELLAKLIQKADSQKEALDIMMLGTTYKRTGFHFDKRLEKSSDKIFYLKKNEELSFYFWNKQGEGVKGEAEAVEMRNCGFQARNKGVTKAVMTEVEGEESTIYRSNATSLKHTLIIGDNYPALQNLLITYRERVKVIYIDPPYGKDDLGEFAKTNYHNAITRDNLLSMLYPRLQLAKELLKDDGVIFCSIDDKNQAYVKCLFDEVFGEENFVANFVWHSKNKPSGNTSENKKIDTRTEFILCYTKKEPQINKNENTEDDLLEKGYNLTDEYFEKRGRYKLTPLMHSCSASSFQYLESLDYEIQAPDGTFFKNHQNIKKPKSYCYTWRKKLFDFGNANGFIEFKKTNDGFWCAYRKMYEFCTIDNKKLEIIDRKSGNAYHNIITESKMIKNIYSDSGANEVRNIMNDKIFANPKPTNLLKHLLKISTTPSTQAQATKEQFTPPPPQSNCLESKDSNIADCHDSNGVSHNPQDSKNSKEVSCGDFVGFQGGGEGVNKALMTEADTAESRKITQETTQGDIILDFFAGSGTTGHAVLELNREDGGNRQFILVTNNEITPLNPNGIAKDVTSKRLKRIMSGECYDKSTNFKWLEKNKPYGGILEVLDIAEVSEYEKGKGKSAFEVIDETCYGLEPFKSVGEKIKWVCENFENTRDILQMQGENDNLLGEKEWEEKLKNGNITGS